MRVLFLGQVRVLHPWYDDFVAALKARDGGHEVRLYDRAAPLEPQFRDIEVVVDQGGVVGTREMIDFAKAAGVKLWQVLGTGLDHVDVDYILESGLTLANTPGQFSAIALAEHALFLMLWFSKNYAASQTSIRSGIMCDPINDELGGKTLGLVGLGASARELAKRAWPMDMRIIALDAADVPRQKLDELHVDWFGKPSDLHELLRQSDFVSIHVPLFPSTRHLINAKAFGTMKDSAIIINVARGEIIDEAAMVDALRSNRIRGAGLDVFAHEPLPIDHELFSLPNVVLTPHQAGVTRGTSRRRGEACADNVARIASGQEPQFVVREAGVSV